MIILVSSLSFAGDTLGAFRYYNTTIDGYTYYTKDSVFLVDIWDGSGTRCSFSVDRAVYKTHIYSLSTIDTNFVYFDGSFLIDIFKYPVSYSYVPLPLKHLRFPIISGDWWQAVDTCFFPLNQTYPYLDLDLDGVVDSIFVDTATSRVIRVAGDTVEISISEVFMKIRYTEQRIIDIDTATNDTLIYRNYTDHIKFDMRVVYVANLGYISYHIDTLWKAISYDIIHTTPYDSTHIPPVFYPYSQYYIRELVPTSISEGGESMSEHTKIYDISGRLIYEGTIGNFKPRKKGIYFIKEGKVIRKIIY